jgi:hypothetical protein
VQLSELTRHDPKRTRGKGRGHRPLGSVPPKYRNPKDPSQTWAGRGLQPLWLRDALKSGKKLDSFFIAKAAKVTGRTSTFSLIAASTMLNRGPRSRHPQRAKCQIRNMLPTGLPPLTSV